MSTSRKETPFGKGRRTGPDGRINRDESFEARTRENNPPREEWFISSGWLTPSIVGEIDTSGINIHVFPLRSIAGTLDCAFARTHIDTAGGSGQSLRTCIYEYVDGDDLKRPLFRKVRDSEAVFSLENNTKGIPPMDVRLDRDGATLFPGKPYFLGYKCTSSIARFSLIGAYHVPLTPPAPPIIVEMATDIPRYSIPVTNTPLNPGNLVEYSRMVHAPLPDQIRILDMAKAYIGTAPCVSYISRKAKNLY